MNIEGTLLEKRLQYHFQNNHAIFFNLSYVEPRGPYKILAYDSTGVLVTTSAANIYSYEKFIALNAITEIRTATGYNKHCDPVTGELLKEETNDKN